MIYFRGCHTLEEDKVFLASLHLDGVAPQWFYQLECEFGIMTLPKFVEFTNLQFCPPIRTNSLGELKILQCSGSV